MPKISGGGASGGGQLAVPANAYVREDGVVTAPPAAAGTLLAANNLSDVDSPTSAQSNLGLGSAALLAAPAVAQTANNLSDLDSAPTALANLGIAQFESGAISNNVSLSSSSATTVITTASLAAGTWKIDAGITCQNSTASVATAYEAEVSGGTAVYTATGATSAAADHVSAASATLQVAHLHLSFLAVVTSPGTVIIAVKASTSTTPLALAATPVNSYAGATGYTAAKMA
jgi:hypothetical protein